MAGVGAGQVQAGPARLQGDQEDVGAALLEGVDRALPADGRPPQRHPAHVARRQPFRDQLHYAGELREDQNASALGELLADQLHEGVVLRRSRLSLSSAR
jgi:hypothetical protein